jgi:hypothetical protein
MLQATQRLMITPSKSPDFDCYLKYAHLPSQSDFGYTEEVGEYDGHLVGEYVALTLADGRKAYTKSENVR